MADMNELKKKVNPSDVAPEVLFEETEDPARAKELMEGALSAEMDTVRKSRKSLMRYAAGGVILELVLAAVRTRVQGDTLKVLLLGAIIILAFVLLTLMRETRRFESILSDEENTLKEIRSGGIDALDFLGKFRVHKKEEMEEKGMKEDFEAYRRLWEESRT